LRKLLLLVVLLASIAVAAVATAATKPPPTKVTTLEDNYFTKGKLTIKKNTTVVWKWRDTYEEHTVTDIKRKWGSKSKLSGSYRHKFAKKGTFTVYCKVHPVNMRQKIVVK
jgi:plastocyanin